MIDANARDAPLVRPEVAFLGLGTMGAPMARNLLRAGLPVRVWNRTSAAARALVDDGARIASSPREAAAGAAIVVTMLSDAEAVFGVVSGADGLLAGMGGGAVWVQMSTIGAEGTMRCLELARAAGAAFVDAPVSGSKGPAEAGALVVLASGEAALALRVAPLFDAVGAKTLWLGEAGAGTRFKVVVNAWLFYQMHGAAEVAALARATDVPLERFVDFLAESPLGAPAAVAKLKKLQHANYAPEFSLQWALKDLHLALASARTAHLDLPAARTIADVWERCVAAGYGAEDVIGVARGVGAAPPA